MKFEFSRGTVPIQSDPNLNHKHPYLKSKQPSLLCEVLGGWPLTIVRMWVLPKVGCFCNCEEISITTSKSHYQSPCFHNKKLRTKHTQRETERERERLGWGDESSSEQVSPRATASWSLSLIPWWRAFWTFWVPPPSLSLLSLSICYSPSSLPSSASEIKHRVKREKQRGTRCEM